MNSWETLMWKRAGEGGEEREYVERDVKHRRKKGQNSLFSAEMVFE